jgi:hypothetical protein
VQIHPELRNFDFLNLSVEEVISARRGRPNLIEYCLELPGLER